MRINVIIWGFIYKYSYDYTALGIYVAVAIYIAVAIFFPPGILILTAFASAFSCFTAINVLYTLTIVARSLPIVLQRGLSSPGAYRF